MNILIYGSGYVGLVTAVCLADTGNNVDCLDVDKDKIETLNAGHSTIYEPNLEELLKKGLKNSTLSFKNNLKKIDYDAIFICVGTPDDSSGKTNLDYVHNVCDEIAKKINKNTPIYVKSTVPIGTCSELELRINSNISENKIRVTVSSCPEFLREGSAILDFQRPTRVILGSDDQKAKDIARIIFSPYIHMNGNFLVMSKESSEMTKYASNSFLATKISFMNELSRLCDSFGANIDDVRSGMSLDNRISGKFLYAGIGYGGSCFPKDIKSLISQANDRNLSMSIIEAADKVNNEQITYLYKLFRENTSVQDKKISIFGLAFKPNTDDIRYAPSISLIKMLIKDDYQISVHDPIAEQNFKKELRNERISYKKDIYDLVTGCDVLIICTEWSRIFNVDLKRVKSLMNGKYVFDGRNCLVQKDWEDAGFKYFGIGVNSK